MWPPGPVACRLLLGRPQPQPWDLRVGERHAWHRHGINVIVLQRAIGAVCGSGGAREPLPPVGRHFPKRLSRYLFPFASHEIVAAFSPVMPSFLKGLRSKSRPHSSEAGGKNGYHSSHTPSRNGNGVAQRKSSSTSNSAPTTPAPSSASDDVTAQPTPPRSGTPPLPTPRASRPDINASKRYSMNVRGNGLLSSLRNSQIADIDM